MDILPYLCELAPMGILCIKCLYKQAQLSWDRLKVAQLRWEQLREAQLFDSVYFGSEKSAQRSSALKFSFNSD